MKNTKYNIESYELKELEDISNDLKRPYRGNNFIKYLAYAFDAVILASLVL
ncbi:conserved hypothetical protein [Methanococcus vannielii SB]|uniref:Uncharacterized protein n=1 Tax=Methanococcus vannielii (strain ATCC 35089 / DSM 1224 / JCM 13029 / OCM 148 / SB) TaxID=406327 RepID=A6UQM1_METVS|nr:hypothetical protein [Methanococcus vannielii]ABR54793.1 conserved hypothetical protein [Methanococcus vannielii SB]